MRILVFVITTLFLPCYDTVGDITYVVGVNTGQAQSSVVKLWGPTFEDLLNLNAAFDGVPFRFKLLPLPVDTHVWDAVIRNHTIDFLFTQPMIANEMKAMHPSLTFVATLVNLVNGQPLFHFGGVIFSHKASKVTTMAECQNAPIGAVSTYSWHGYLLQYYTMKQAGFLPTNIIFLSSQANVLAAVRNGGVTCGFVRTGLLEQWNDSNLVLINAQKDVRYPLQLSTVLSPECPVLASASVPTAVWQWMSAKLLSVTPDSPAAFAGAYAGWIPALDYASVDTILAVLGLLPSLSVPLPKWVIIVLVVIPSVLLLIVVMVILGLSYSRRKQILIAQEQEHLLHCADLIASLRLEQCSEALLTLPSATQEAFKTIIHHLGVYRSYLPDAVLVDEHQRAAAAEGSPAADPPGTLASGVLKDTDSNQSIDGGSRGSRPQSTFGKHSVSMDDDNDGVHEIPRRMGSRGSIVSTSSRFNPLNVLGLRSFSPRRTFPLTSPGNPPSNKLVPTFTSLVSVVPSPTSASPQHKVGMHIGRTPVTRLCVVLGVGPEDHTTGALITDIVNVVRNMRGSIQWQISRQVMCYWNASNGSTQAANYAMDAALEILKVAKGHPISNPIVTIAISTCTCYVGNIGGATFRVFSIIPHNGLPSSDPLITMIDLIDTVYRDLSHPSVIADSDTFGRINHHIVGRHLGVVALTPTRALNHDTTHKHVQPAVAVWLLDPSSRVTAKMDEWMYELAETRIDQKQEQFNAWNKAVVDVFSSVALPSVLTSIPVPLFPGMKSAAAGSRSTEWTPPAPTTIGDCITTAMVEHLSLDAVNSNTCTGLRMFQCVRIVKSVFLPTHALGIESSSESLLAAVTPPPQEFVQQGPPSSGQSSRVASAVSSFDQGCSYPRPLS